EVDFGRETGFSYAFIGIAAVLWLLSCWTGSAASRHLLLLSLVLYAALLAVGRDSVVAIAAALAAVSAGLFALAVVMPAEAERIVRLGGLLPVHGLIGFLTGMVMIQLEIADEDSTGFAIAAAIALAGIVAALVFAGRESRGLRWIAYIGFAVELCLIYVTMIRDMFGTAGFFLAAGVILGLLALAIIRVEKRMKEPRLPEGAAA